MGLIAPRTMSGFAIHESDRDTLEQMADIQEFNRGAAVTAAYAPSVLAGAVISGPSVVSAGYAGYRSPVGQCIKEISQNVIFEAVTNMDDPSPSVPDAKTLAEENMRNRTEQVQRDTRPRVRIPDVLICKR